MAPIQVTSVPHTGPNSIAVGNRDQLCRERNERVQDHERDRGNRRPRAPGFGDPLDPLDREVEPRHHLLDAAQTEAEHDASSHRRQDTEDYEERLPQGQTRT